MGKVKRLLKNQTFRKAVRKANSFAVWMGELAPVLVHVKRDPSPMDYVAIGLSVYKASMRIVSESVFSDVDNYWNYFDDDSWTTLPHSLISTVFPIIENAKADVISDNEKHCAYKGSIGDVSVGWNGSPDTPDKKPMSLYYEKGRLDEMVKVIRDAIWGSFSSKNLVFGDAGLAEDILSEPDVRETEFIRDLRSRVNGFLKLGENRGYLIEGIPGTGKSTAVRAIVSDLDLTSLRVELNAFRKKTDTEQFWGLTPSLDFLIKIVRPDVIVIDDLDRLQKHDQPQLLSMFEEIQKTCKVVMVTINNRGNILNPILRPGRLDDHIEVGDMDDDVVKGILGPSNFDLVDEVKSWPISYILDFRKREKVFGSDKARSELPGLHRRVEEAKRAHEPKIELDEEDPEDDSPVCG